MAAVAEGSPAAAQAASAAAAAAKEAEYHKDVQKLVDLLSKLNPAAKEFVPSSAAVTPRKGLSADAPVFYYGPIGGRNGGIGGYSGADAGYIGYQQRMVKFCSLFSIINHSEVGTWDLGREAWIGAVVLPYAEDLMRLLFCIS